MRQPVDPVVGGISVALTDRVTYWTLVQLFNPSASALPSSIYSRCEKTPCIP